MKRPPHRFLKPLCIAAGFLFLIGVWYLVSLILQSQGNYGVPYPHDTFVLSLRMLFSKDPNGEWSAKGTWQGIGWTLLRLLIGYGVSLVAGLLFGLLAGLFPRVKDCLRPSMGLLKTIPTVAVVLMLVSVVLASGQHRNLNWIPIVLVFIISFPLIFQATAAGIENETADVLDALKLEAGVRHPKSVLFVLLPDSWPFIRLGMAQSLGLSLKVTIMSEALMTSSAVHLGIGNLIRLSQSSSDGGLREIPAYSLIALAMMILIDLPLLTIKALEKKEEKQK